MLICAFNHNARLVEFGSVSLLSFALMTHLLFPVNQNLDLYYLLNITLE